MAEQDPATDATDAPAPATPKGFAAMTPERRRAIASAGGKAAQATGKVKHWTSETAREAGRAGGRKGKAPRQIQLELPPDGIT